jgi:hypothetical protein
MSDFINVNQTIYNLWDSAWPNLYNVGGILGAAYFPQGTAYANYNSFWLDLLPNGVLTQFAIDLVPQADDWSWIPYAPNLTALQSYMIVGDFNVSDYIDLNQTTLTMNSVSNSTWLFNLT